MKIQTKLIIVMGGILLLHSILLIFSYNLISSSSYKILAFTIIFVSLISFVLFIVNSQLIKPLKILSQSLLYRNYEQIDKMSKNGTSELSNLANMMLNFFKQRNDLLIEVSERKQAEEKSQQNILMQRAINNLLSISLENIPFDSKLKFFLVQLFAISWIQLEEKGAIFLKKKNTYAMETQMNLDLKLSSELKSFYESESIGNNADIFTKNDIFTCTEIGDLNHFCLSIKNRHNLLGFIILFQKKEYKLNKEEKEFLEIASNICSEMVKRNLDEIEKTQIQLRLMQSSKMADIGKMAAGIAHEINNPLTIISGNAQYINMSECIEADQDIKESLESIQQAANRCRNIISNLLHFSKQRNLEFNEIDVNLLLEDTIKLSLFQKELQNINIIKEFSEDLPLVKGSTSHLGQVFLNIMLNAGQAMPGGGTLTLKTKKDDNNENVEILFSDSGYGIDSETVQNIFEPFFTTKEKGTGLGLSVSHEIIKKHNGKIRALSNGKDKGATFVVSFPVSNT